MLLVEKRALGGNALAGKFVQSDGAAVGPHHLHSFEDFHRRGLAVEPLRRPGADRFAQLGRGIKYCRPTHHDRARMIGAVAVAHIRGGAVEDAADAIDRDFERIGGDLGESGLQPLADRG